MAFWEESFNVDGFNKMPVALKKIMQIHNFF